MEYFAPLLTFLTEENKKLDVEAVRTRLLEHNVEASLYCNTLVKADWDVTTDLENLEKQAILSEQIKVNAQFMKQQYEIFKDYKLEDFNDIDIQRQLQFLSVLGTDILEDADLDALRAANTQMELIYNTAKVCPFTNQNCNLDTQGLPLDPG